MTPEQKKDILDGVIIEVPSFRYVNESAVEKILDTTYNLAIDHCIKIIEEAEGEASVRDADLFTSIISKLNQLKK